MGAVIQIVVFVSLLGVITYFSIMWYAKRNHKIKVKVATEGKLSVDRQIAQRKKSFWKKFFRIAMLILCSAIVISALNETRKRNR